MSAATQPLPKPAPPQRLVPVTAPEPGKPFWLKLLIALVVIAIIAAAAWYALKPKPQAISPLVTFKTVAAQVAPLDVTLRMSGVTSARNFVNITAPLLRGPENRGSLVMNYLAKSGALVKKGEKIVELDATSALDHIEDTRDTVRQAENDVFKRKAEQSVEMAQLEQTLRVAKASYDKAHLDAGAAEVKTDIERELLKLAEEETGARYKEQQQDLAFRKASQASEIKILEITLERQRRHLGRHEHDLDRYTTMASMDGLAVMQTVFRGGEMAQIQQGDQVYPGQQIMKIVDPKSMQVEGSVSQSDASALRIGQEVEIGLDAFPGVKYTGKIYSIGALAVSGWRQNYYIRAIPVRVTISSYDSRVIPDLSAHCNILLQRHPDTLQVPLAAVRETGAGKGEVWVKTPTGFERRDVTLGERNSLSVAVVGGLKAGEEVRIGG